MAGKSPYSTSKIVHHLEAMDALRQGKVIPPVFVQWFPCNLCNQACEFCSYGHWKPGTQGPPPEEWKNHVLFDEKKMLPKLKMLETCACLQDMGVRAVEITGGGEPTVYPFFDLMVENLGAAGIELGLVSNGVLIDQRRADLLAENNFLWARISIDAGSAATYAKTRHVPAHHFEKALKALRLLSERKMLTQTRVGMGYVIDRYNWSEVYEGARIAKENGADSIRISVAFTPDGMSRWPKENIMRAIDLSEMAKADFDDDNFSVSDLSFERFQNMELQVQDYPFCYWKEIGCVIGADGHVYSCCSLAYNPKGIMGEIRTQTFREMWYSDRAVLWRQRHQPRFDCPVWCLYETRNRAALKFIVDEFATEDERVKGEPPHVNFV
jgi:MoaA/NifB/PqqE/SkfB family radical SAM enzyme